MGEGWEESHLTANNFHPQSTGNISQEVQRNLTLYWANTLKFLEKMLSVHPAEHWEDSTTNYTQIHSGLS